MLALRTVQRGGRHRAVLTSGRAHRGRAGPCSARAVLTGGGAHPGAVLSPGQYSPSGRAHRGWSCAVPCSASGRAHPGAVLCSRGPCPTPGPCSPRGRAHRGQCRAVPCRAVSCRAYPGHGPARPAPLPARCGQAGVSQLHPLSPVLLSGGPRLECAGCAGDSTGVALPPRPAHLGRPREAAPCAQRCGAAVPPTSGWLWGARSCP